MEFHDYCRQLAEFAQAEYFHALTPELYVCGRPATGGTFDVLGIFRDGSEPDDFSPVLPEPLPCHLTVVQLSTWLKARLKYQPILQALKSA